MTIDDHKDIHITDDYMFYSVMEAMPDCCQKIIELARKQKRLSSSLALRDLRAGFGLRKQTDFLSESVRILAERLFQSEKPPSYTLLRGRVLLRLK
jgi:hypothetical protein